MVEQSSKGLDVRVLVHYLNTFKEGSETYAARVAVFQGKDKEEAKQRFAKDARVRLLHEDGDQLFMAFKAAKYSHQSMLNRNVFFAKPVLIRNGFTYWTLASWDKKHLTDLYNRIKKIGPDVKIETLSVSKGSLNLFLPAVLSRMTSRQKEALETALEEGYYDYPREMSMEEIAKKHRIARTTFQSHLRKAEKKVISALMEQEHI